MERHDLRRVPNIGLQFEETVQLLSRQAANQSTFFAWKITRAQRKKISDEEKLAHNLLNVTVLKFRIGQDALDNAQFGTAGTNITPEFGPAPPPKPRDLIVAVDGTWIIIDKGVERILLGAAHECICQKATGPTP